MLALLRPDSWDFPLYLHVLGATLLFGSALALSIVGVGAWRVPARSQLLARIGFWTIVGLLLPAFVLMRVGAQLIVDKEFPDNATTPGWVDAGFIVSEPGLAVVIALLTLTWISSRRNRRGTTAAFAILALVYLAALLVAMFAMTGKPGS